MDIDISALKGLTRERGLSLDYVVEAIEQALARIAHGAYGKCLDCDVAIAITRLLAAPSALRCIDCQTAAEKVLGPGAALH